MKKMKKLAAICLAILFVVSLAVPASAADTEDKRSFHQWTAYTRRDQTDMYLKYDSSRVYMRTINNSQPIGGVDWQTMIQDASGTIRFSKFYTVTDYRSYAINHEQGAAASGKLAGLQSYYPYERYSSGGDVTIMWSPDYANDGSVLLG